MSRRHFVKTMGLATTGIPFYGSGPSSPFAQYPKRNNSTVATARLSTYGRVPIRSAIESMFGNLGGLSDIVRTGDRVGIKINLTGGYESAHSFEDVSGLPPGESYWTHPEILRAVGELLLDAGAGEVYVIEAVYDWESYASYGYKAVTDYLGATFVDLNQTSPFAGYAIRSVGSQAFIYPTLTQNGILNDLDCLVSLAKSKRHNGAGVTHGIKNLVGTLPMPPGIYNNGQGYRAAIHSHTSYDGNTSSNLCRVIMDINKATPIHLVVNDAIKTVLGGEGPWGTITPAPFDTLIASKDPVAADAVGTQVIGFDPMASDQTTPFPDGINYLRMANSLGMGEYDLSRIDVVQAASSGNEDPSGPDADITLTNFPNPLVSTTTFEYVLQNQEFVSLAVFNLMGQRVRTLLSESRPAGINRVDWDGCTDRGQRVSSGTYIALLKVNSRTVSRKISVFR